MNHFLNAIVLVGLLTGAAVKAELGHLDIELTSASLYSSANAYATVCIQNVTQYVPLPVQDRSHCVSCASPLAPYGSYAVWNAICAGSGNYIFSSQSQIIFEVWDHHGEGNNEFLGGSTITTNEMLDHGDNHQAIHLALNYGKIHGQMNTIITWTPLP